MANQPIESTVALSFNTSGNDKSFRNCQATVLFGSLFFCCMHLEKRVGQCFKSCRTPSWAYDSVKFGCKICEFGVVQYPTVLLSPRRGNSHFPRWKMSLNGEPSKVPARFSLSPGEIALLGIAQRRIRIFRGHISPNRRPMKVFDNS